jgi:hypothetical protein
MEGKNKRNGPQSTTQEQPKKKRVIILNKKAEINHPKTKTTTEEQLLRPEDIKNNTQLKKVFDFILEKTKLRENYENEFKKQRERHKLLQDSLKTTLMMIEIQKPAMEKKAKPTDSDLKELLEKMKQEYEKLQEKAEMLTKQVKEAKERYNKAKVQLRWLGLITNFTTEKREEGHKCCVCMFGVTLKAFLVLRCSHLICHDCYGNLKFYDLTEEMQKKYAGMKKLKQCPMCRQFIPQSNYELGKHESMSKIADEMHRQEAIRLQDRENSRRMNPNGANLFSDDEGEGSDEDLDMYDDLDDFGSDEEEDEEDDYGISRGGGSIRGMFNPLVRLNIPRSLLNVISNIRAPTTTRSLIPLINNASSANEVISIEDEDEDDSSQEKSDDEGELLSF